MQISSVPVEDTKYKRLKAKAESLSIPEKDIPQIIFHIDKLSNIIIDSYISSKKETK